jgi:hypothetical protein
VDKGSRVRIKSGPKTGIMGSIFWKGADKYRGGSRFGVRGDDGETHWVSETEVEPTDTPEQVPDNIPTFEKGDRVQFKERGQTGTGTVFWLGDSRRGGQRLGVRNDDDPDNAVWIDARFCERIEGEAPESAQSRSSGGRGGGRSGYSGGDWGADDDQVDNSAEAAMAGMSELVPEPPPHFDGPPMDDSYYDSIAGSVDDDDSPPW